MELREAELVRRAEELERREKEVAQRELLCAERERRLQVRMSVRRFSFVAVLVRRDDISAGTRSRVDEPADGPFRGHVF